MPLERTTNNQTSWKFIKINYMRGRGFFSCLLNVRNMDNAFFKTV